MLWVAMENWSEVFALSSKTSLSCASMSRSYVGLGCVACFLFVILVFGFVPHAKTLGIGPSMISPFGCHWFVLSSSSWILLCVLRLTIWWWHLPIHRSS